MKEIKKIVLLKNVVIYNKHHERGYLNRKGVIEIEYSNGSKSIVDLGSTTDISNSDYLIVNNIKKTKEKVLFKNIMFDTERLEKLAK